MQRVTRYDKAGKPFQVGLGAPDDLAPLLSMYDSYSPRPASQGLPPADPALCSAWAKKLFGSSINILAWRGGRVVGHAALLPEPERNSCEFIIFIDQDNRDIGVGSALTALAIDEARGEGFSSIWLTVEVPNRAAIWLYRKVGFEFADAGNSYERVMVLRTASAGSS